MRSMLFAVLCLSLVGFALVHLLRERPHYSPPPLLPADRDAGGTGAAPLPAEMPPPAPRSRGLDPQWPGAAPPQAPPDLRPADPAEPPPPPWEPDRDPAAEHSLSRVLGRLSVGAPALRQEARHG